MDMTQEQEERLEESNQLKTVERVNQVLEEVRLLKQYMPVAERRNLNLAYFCGNSIQECYYGQMTGRHDSLRATQIKDMVASHDISMIDLSISDKPGMHTDFTTPLEALAMRFITGPLFVPYLKNEKKKLPTVEEVMALPLRVDNGTLPDIKYIS